MMYLNQVDSTSARLVENTLGSLLRIIFQAFNEKYEENWEMKKYQAGIFIEPCLRKSLQTFNEKYEENWVMGPDQVDTRLTLKNTRLKFL